MQGQISHVRDTFCLCRDFKYILRTIIFINRYHFFVLMPKSINQRGFKTDMGNAVDDVYIRYEIDKNGLEVILISREQITRSSYIIADNGRIKSLQYAGKYITVDAMGREEKEELVRAKEVYEEVKRVLHVSEKLKKYSAKQNDSNLYDFLGIDHASQIQLFLPQ